MAAVERQLQPSFGVPLSLNSGVTGKLLSYRQQKERERGQRLASSAAEPWMGQPCGTWGWGPDSSFIPPSPVPTRSGVGDSSPRGRRCPGPSAVVLGDPGQARPLPPADLALLSPATEATGGGVLQPPGGRAAPTARRGRAPAAGARGAGPGPPSAPAGLRALGPRAPAAAPAHRLLPAGAGALPRRPVHCQARGLHRGGGGGGGRRPGRSGRALQRQALPRPAPGLRWHLLSSPPPGRCRRYCARPLPTNRASAVCPAGPSAPLGTRHPPWSGAVSGSPGWAW